MSTSEEYADRAHPRYTATLTGHHEAEQSLLRLWTGGRLHHAWCISGPKGIGKATLAWRFARFLLAMGDQGPGQGQSGGGGEGSLFGDVLEPVVPETMSVDPDSSVFQRLAAGAHGNLRFLERSIDPKKGRRRSEIIVDDVRKLNNFFTKTASEDGWRIAIVDSADELNRNAANALLKILEEPPEQSILLLVSHSPGRLLATIRSRCQQLPLSPLSLDETTSVLLENCPDMTEGEARSLALMAEGAPGIAIRLADEGGLEHYGRMLSLLKTLPKVPVSKLFGLVDDLTRRRKSDGPLDFARLLVGWLGRSIRAAAGGEDLPEIVEGEGAERHRLLAAIPLDCWVEVWEKMGRLISQTEALNLDHRQLVFRLFQTMEEALAE